MKIGIVGDTHGSQEAIGIIARSFNDVQVLFHTGDHWQDGIHLEREMGIPVLVVKGNCDYGSMPRELLRTIKGENFFMTHGHLYGVKYGLDTLWKRAQDKKADYCLFGHTHRPLLTEYKGIRFLNPGSITWPRSKNTYAGILLQYHENSFTSSLLNIDRE